LAKIAILFYKSTKIAKLAAIDAVSVLQTVSGHSSPGHDSP